MARTAANFQIRGRGRIGSQMRPGKRKEASSSWKSWMDWKLAGLLRGIEEEIHSTGMRRKLEPWKVRSDRGKGGGRPIHIDGAMRSGFIKFFFFRVSVPEFDSGGGERSRWARELFWLLFIRGCGGGCFPNTPILRG